MKLCGAVIRDFKSSKIQLLAADKTQSDEILSGEGMMYKER